VLTVLPVLGGLEVVGSPAIAACCARGGRGGRREEAEEEGDGGERKPRHGCRGPRETRAKWTSHLPLSLLALFLFPTFPEDGPGINSPHISE
jgi:hypothetical protein